MIGQCDAAEVDGTRYACLLRAARRAAYSDGIGRLRTAVSVPVVAVQGEFNDWP